MISLLSKGLLSLLQNHSSPSVDGNLAKAGKIKKSHTLLRIDSADLLKHAKHLVRMVLHYSTYVLLLSYVLCIVWILGPYPTKNLIVFSPVL